MLKEAVVPPRRRRVDWPLIGLIGGLLVVGILCWLSSAPIEINRLGHFDAQKFDLQVSGNRIIAHLRYGNGSLICFDAMTGRAYWSKQQAYYDIVVSDGKVAYINLYGLVMMQVKNGERLWARYFSQPLCADGRGGMAVTGSQLLVTDGLDCAVLDVNTGKLILTETFMMPNAEMGRAPTLDGQVVYFGGQGGGLYAYDLGTHRMVWSHPGHVPRPSQHPVASGIIGRPFLFSDTVIFVSVDGVVSGVERKTGHIIWQISLGLHLFGEGGCVIGSMLVIPYDGGIVGLDLRAGSVQFNVDSLGKDENLKSLVLAGGPVQVIFLAPFNSHEALVFIENHIFRLTMPSGTLHHVADMPEADKRITYWPGCIVNPPSVPHRLLLIGSSDGWVYTLNLDSLYFHSLFEKSYKPN